MTPILTAALAASGPAHFEDVCHATWSGQHGAAPRLLELVAEASTASGVVRPDERDAEWVVSALSALGFAGPGSDGAMRADEPTLDALLTARNRARRRVHADAEAARRRQLAKLLDELAGSTLSRGDLRAAREALRDLPAPDGSSLAEAPVLLGVAALLRAQAAAPERALATWRCPREALLNGGDALVPRLLRAFGALRLRPSGSLHVEDGEMGDLKLSIAPGAWPQLCLEQF